MSVKKDPYDTRLAAITSEISSTDSSTWCQTIDRINKGVQKANIRAQIRSKILWNGMKPRGMKCPNDPSLIDNFRDALQAAYEIEDEMLQYTIHLSLGQIYNGMSQYGLAVMHFQMYFDILRRNNRADFFLPSGAFYDMSFSLYHTHDYAGCIRTGLNAMSALPKAQFMPDNTLNPYQQMQQWNTIGLAYHKIHLPDSAFLAFDNAEKMANKIGGPFWIGIIRGNKVMCITISVDMILHTSYCSMIMIIASLHVSTIMRPIRCNGSHVSICAKDVQKKLYKNCIQHVSI